MNDLPVRADAPRQRASGAPPADTGLTVVGMGASAGGLEALTSFFGRFETRYHAAFVVVVHLTPDERSSLDELLSRHASFPVFQAQDGMALKPGFVYVIPPNRYLLLRRGRFRLEQPRESRGQRRPIDVFLRSLAADRGAKALGIILSGAGHDGTRGMAAIKEGGGTTFAQLPETAAYESMPRSVIEAGVVDHALPVEEMPGLLTRHFAIFEASPGTSSDDDATSSPEFLNAFDRQVAAPLVQRATPGTTLRAWMPRCGTGVSAYAVAMVVLQVLGRRADVKLRLFATDSDPEILDKARSGRLTETQAATLPRALVRRFFERRGDGFQATDELRSVFRFSLHDFALDPPFSRLDLLAAVRLPLAGSAVERQRLAALCHFAMRPGGAVLFASGEDIGNQLASFAAVSRTHGFYVRSENPETPAARELQHLVIPSPSDSGTEDLETSQERMRTLVEELHIVNSELQDRYEEVEAAHDDLKNLVASADVATLFLDPELRINRFTPAMNRYLGLLDGDLGRPLGDLSSELERRAELALERGEDLERLVDDNESTAHIERVRPYRTANHEIAGVVVTLVDVSELRAKERALERSERYHRALIENAPDVVLVLGGDGKIHDESSSLRRHLGLEDREVAGRDFFSFLHPDDQDALRRSFTELLDGQRARPIPDCRFTRGDGSWASIEGTWQNLTEDTAVAGVVVNFRDVSRRLKAEDDKRKLEERLLHTQRLELIGQLAGGIAHDFNNLLTQIYLGVDKGLSPKDCPEPQRSALRSISEAAERARNLTRQLLAFSRRQVLERKVIEIDELIGRLARLLDRVLGEHVELTIELAASKARVLADSSQLEQVFINLAVNARDSMPQGGEILLATRLEERAEHAGPAVAIRIEDHGQGMNEETRRRAFEPFFTTKPMGKGTGLGLSMAYGIVKQHGGEVDIESLPGEGTTVTVLLPLTEDAARGQGPTPSRRPGAHRETILFVEDEKELLELAAESLGALGYRVLPVSDGEAAVSLFDRHADEIDLLVSDVVLRGSNGRDVARALRRRRPDLPVLLISGHTCDVLAEEANPRLDDVHYLRKPFNAGALAAMIQQVLSGRRPANHRLS